MIQAVRGLLRRPTLKAAGLLLVCLLICFHDVVFEGRTFLTHDYAAGSVPGGGGYGYAHDAPGDGRPPAADLYSVAVGTETCHAFNRDVFRRGELPLWDPYSGAGQPHLSCGYGAVFEPVQALTYLGPRSWWPGAMDLEVLVRYFLAGLFTYLFLRELGLDFWPCAFGAAGFMLSNHLLDYGAHVGLRVHALIPLLLLGLERLRKAPSAGNTLLAAGAALWVLLADFPEAAFLALSFGSLWYAFGALAAAWRDPARRWSAFSPAPHYLFTMACAFALAAPLLLPFLENVQASETMHGLKFGSGALTLPANLLVLALVPLYRAYPGVEWVPHFSAAVLVLALLGALAARRTAGAGAPCLFFGAYFVTFFAAIYGAPVFRCVGSLPLYRQVLLVKYCEPSLEFCLVVLAAHGLQALAARAAPPWARLAVLPCLALAFLACLPWAPPAVALDLPFWKAGAAVLIVAAAAWALVLAAPSSPAKASLVAAGLLALLAGETCCRQAGVKRHARHYPYNAPPFIQYVLNRDEPGRVCALGDVPTVNMAMAFGFDDLRFLASLDPGRRAACYRAFLAPACRDIRLTGYEKPFCLDAFYDLLDGRYVVVTGREAPRTRLSPIDPRPWVRSLDETRYAALFGEGTGMIPERVQLRDGPRDVVRTPPDGGELAIPVALPVGPIRLHIGCGFPAKDAGLPNGHSTFRVLLRDATGTHLVFERRAGAAAAEGWDEAVVDLSAWSGRPVVLVLRTDPEGAGMGAGACWGLPEITVEQRPHFWSEPGSESGKFELAFEGDGVQIYRNRWAFPRAFVVYRAEAAGGLDEAVARMKRPDFDPSSRVVLEGAPAEALGRPGVGAADAARPTAARITRRTANSVVVRADAERAGFLVLSETFAAGWYAYVDGKPAPVYPADGMLRAVTLEPGIHEVRFVYFPVSLKAGLWTCLAGALALAGRCAAGRLMRRRRVARSAAPAPPDAAAPRDFAA